MGRDVSANGRRPGEDEPPSPIPRLVYAALHGVLGGRRTLPLINDARRPSLKGEQWIHLDHISHGRVVKANDSGTAGQARPGLAAEFHAPDLNGTGRLRVSFDNAVSKVGLMLGLREHHRPSWGSGKFC